MDVNRNAYAQHAVAPYGVRPRPRAPVAAPIHWEELSDSKLRPDRWTVKTIGDRIDSEGDPWKGMAGTRGRCRRLARHGHGPQPAGQRRPDRLPRLAARQTRHGS